MKNLSLILSFFVFLCLTPCVSLGNKKGSPKQKEQKEWIEIEPQLNLTHFLGPKVKDAQNNILGGISFSYQTIYQNYIWNLGAELDFFNLKNNEESISFTTLGAKTGFYFKPLFKSQKPIKPFVFLKAGIGQGKGLDSKEGCFYLGSNLGLSHQLFKHLVLKTFLPFDFYLLPSGYFFRLGLGISLAFVF